MELFSPKLMSEHAAKYWDAAQADPRRPERDETRVIRLPKVSPARKLAYMRAAGRAKKPLTDWMLDACDEAILKKQEPN